MKQLFSTLFILFLFAAPAFSKGNVANGKLTWYTDINKAQALSQSAHKPIFAFFTGSDWCGWCHRLERNVFDKETFIKWAQDKVILLELDFPRNKQLAPELVQQNNSLQQAFQVGGYPTIWIFYLNKDAASSKMNINALGSLGYPTSEPGKEDAAFLQEANRILSMEKKVIATPTSKPAVKATKKK